ncbi:phosphate acyltransferase [Chakrabartyella piscis]|uniref:phosphate acyltransferase n=1 Tax=Chakrabartyella piscis TaxID=2918914 RepID=UPI0029584712|nr:phosphate acyltransferase [Chakrabartyella piscis]
MNKELKSFDELIARVKTLPTKTIAVAAAEDEEVLTAVKMAVDMGLVQPILTGNQSILEEMVAKVGLTSYEIVDCKTPEEATAKAVSLVKDGTAQVLMKGMVNTSVYMRAILNKEAGLRTGRLISMVAVYELAEYHKLLFCTDSGINAIQGTEQKKQILQNTLIAMKPMGYNAPKTIALTANELYDPKIPSLVDAKVLVDAVAAGEIGDCVIEGPIALDVAFDPHAAEHKGIASKVSGDVDLIVFPNMETGNALGKSWLHFMKAKWAGVVLGASHPVILGSRSDTAEIKINSIALGCLMAAELAE